MAVAKKHVDRDLRLTSQQSEVIMGSLNLVAALGGKGGRGGGGGSDGRTDGCHGSTTTTTMATATTG